MNQEHSHRHHSHGDLKGLKLVFSIFLNLLITIAQAIGGFISGSLALLSDALHNFSDVIALLISYIANRLTSRKFTQRQTFGYRRAEIIAALINAVILIAIAINLAIEAVTRIKSPINVDASLVIILAGLSILVNLASVLILKKEASDNLNIKSAYLHLLSDMVTSIAVLAGGFAMKYWQIFWIDSILSMMIAVYLIYASWGLLISTLKVLMQFAPPDVDLGLIRSEVMKFPEVENIHHIHIWQLNDKECQFEAHIDFKKDLKLSEATRITCQVEKRIKEKFHITHTVIQQEFGHDDTKLLIVDDS